MNAKESPDKKKVINKYFNSFFSLYKINARRANKHAENAYINEYEYGKNQEAELSIVILKVKISIIVKTTVNAVKSEENFFVMK